MTAVSPVSAYTPRRLLLLAAVLLVVGAGALLISHRFGHAPDWVLFAHQGWLLRIHVFAAATALLLGAVQLIGVKGTTAHRAIGWTWVATMTTVAVTSFFMGQGLRSLGPIHLLSALTLALLVVGIRRAHAGNVRAHGNMMTGLYVGALVITGLLAFVPKRLMWAVFFG